MGDMVEDRGLGSRDGSEYQKGLPGGALRIIVIASQILWRLKDAKRSRTNFITRDISDRIFTGTRVHTFI